MGYNLGWLALKNVSEETINKLLSIEPTGSEIEFLDADIIRCNPNNDWQVLIFSNPEHPCLHFDSLLTFSTFGEVISALVYEGSMMSQVSKFKSKKYLWMCEWDGQSIHCHGDAKEEVLAFLEKEEEHDFELPIILAKSLVGYQHDCSYGVDGYRVMDQIPLISKPASQIIPKQKFVSIYSKQRR